MDTLGKGDKNLRRDLEQWNEWRLAGERDENADEKIRNTIGSGRLADLISAKGSGRKIPSSR